MLIVKIIGIACAVCLGIVIIIAIANKIIKVYKKKRNNNKVELKKFETVREQLIQDLCKIQNEIVELRTNYKNLNDAQQREINGKIDKLIETRSIKIADCNRIQEQIEELRNILKITP